MILEDALLPMLNRGIDTIVLGCTHYPFVIPLIENIAGPGVRVIDPAPAVARQVGRVLEGRRQLHGGDSPCEGVRYFTTGEAERLQSLLPRLMGEPGVIGRLEWAGDQLHE
jgi:glutamate racemase